MRIYFYAPPTEKSALKSAYRQIFKLLAQSQVEVFSNFEDKGSDFSPEEKQKLEAQGKLPLDQMTAFVIEGSTPDSEVGYLLAYALSQKKPCLYIYERGTGSQEILKYLMDRNVARMMQVKNYLRANLNEHLIGFLKTLSGAKIREKPNIKFTLRITSPIEKYLEWRTHNTNLSKADFLREDIEQMIKEDEAYQKFLRQG